VALLGWTIRWCSHCSFLPPIHLESRCCQSSWVVQEPPNCLIRRRKKDLIVEDHEIVYMKVSLRKGCFFCPTLSFYPLAFQFTSMLSFSHYLRFFFVLLMLLSNFLNSRSIFALSLSLSLSLSMSQFSEFGARETRPLRYEMKSNLEYEMNYFHFNGKSRNRNN